MSRESTEQLRSEAPIGLCGTEADTVQLPAGVKDLEFKYKVGGGGGHSITIVNFAWSWLLPERRRRVARINGAASK